MRRLLYSTVALTAATAATLLATGATATAGSVGKHRRVQEPPPLAYAGYADSYRAGVPSAPSPWKGSKGVIFEGCNYFHPDRCPKTKSGANRYDSGAIRIEQAPCAACDGVVGMTVTKVSVTIGTCTFRPWPGLNVTVPPGDQLILAQTGGKPPCGTTGGKYNFDTSDTNHANCTDDGDIPLVHMTVDGEKWTFGDPSQVLNTGGFDIGSKMCGHHNETQNWTQLQLPDS